MNDTTNTTLATKRPRKMAREPMADATADAMNTAAVAALQPGDAPTKSQTKAAQVEALLAREPGSIHRDHRRQQWAVPDPARQARSNRLPRAGYRHRHRRGAAACLAHRANPAGDRPAIRLGRPAGVARVRLRPKPPLLNCSQDFGARDGGSFERRCCTNNGSL